ncbi:MAG: tetratricopeptide repeat protein [Gemmatimonadota bacterium]|nr:tetratricopeptide repeat protein [Gemmatimonadota bacterium]
MTTSATVQGTTPRPSATTTSGLSGWLATKQNRLIALGGLVVLVGVITALVILSGQRKEAFAGRALDQARGIAESGNLPLAASELQKVITTYGGTRAAQEAVITLNQVRLVNGQHELAVVGLEEFLKSGAAPQYRAPAYGLLGRALENAGRPAEAAKAYADASASGSTDYIRAEMLLDAGRAYRNAGQPEKAVESYRKVVNEYKDTPFRTEAEVRLAELEQSAM